MKNIAKILAASGLVGLAASTIITVDRIKLLQNPSFVPICDLNPFISCGSVTLTPQASVFGFANSILGILGFAFLTGVGLYLMIKPDVKVWFWRLLNLGLLVAVIFVHWLAYQSLYVIGALCTYCMVIWAVTIFSFVAVTGRHFKLILIFTWYAVIVGLILQHFWYYWRILIGI